ncbi:hypothetical protein F1559_001731 [Cyanidiococcus yangmingshanensis]|uniref:Uncharacterized protein n=1 Tax=Cyanidiococcus yangmingshanensis TaxID=2690220 RepID=A0A7J7IF17_9RHOD|nr:hypothetical protein F1559_001731 [Cyanidiococcus yangmingshanensis]
MVLEEQVTTAERILDVLERRDRLQRHQFCEASSRRTLSTTTIDQPQLSVVADPEIRRYLAAFASFLVRVSDLNSKRAYLRHGSNPWEQAIGVMKMPGSKPDALQ